MTGGGNSSPPTSRPPHQLLERRARLSTIDQWRGISVLLVIIHHLTIYRFRDFFDVSYRLSDFVRHPTTHNVSAVGSRLFYLWAHNIGPLGVQIFFCISGYIITRLLLKEQSNTGTVCFTCFYIRRTFRILPALVFFVFLTWLMSYCGYLSISAVEVGSVATFLCNTSLVSCGYYYGHLWSLCVEEQFYLVWPLMFVFLIGRVRVGMMWGILAACICISVIPRLWVDGWLNNGLSFGCIAAGAAYALSRGFRKLFSWWLRWPTWMIALFLIVGLPLTRSLAVDFWPVTTILTPMLIVAAVLTRADAEFIRESSLLSRFLNRVGRMSYSLYLWHVIFVWEPDRYNSAGFLAASLPLGIVFAWLSATYLEPYFISLGRRYADRANSANASSPPPLQS